MAATPQEVKKFINKGKEQVDEGLPGWFGTFADMMTLLFAFFVLLAAISTIDPVKLQNMADGMGKSVGKKKEIENQAMSLGDIQKEAQKMMIIRIVDVPFGHLLPGENLGQRGSGHTFWRTPLLPIWRPMVTWRRVLSTTLDT